MRCLPLPGAFGSQQSEGINSDDCSGRRDTSLRSLIALNVVAIVVNLYDRLSNKNVRLYFVDDHREATHDCEVANKSTLTRELLDWYHSADQ
jgi:hypothetical protein